MLYTRKKGIIPFRLKRITYAAFALLATATLFAPILAQDMASAAQVTLRSIEMSNATPAATSVKYNLTFTPVSAATELIVDFCDNSPIQGDSCAFSTATVPDLSPGGVDATASAGTVTIVGTGTPKHTIKVTGLTITGGSAFNIVFSGIKNPTTSTGNTFYGRILTYSTGNAGNYVPANSSGGATTIGTGNVDSGGDALTTTQPINLTAKVQEQLTFCTSASNFTTFTTDCTTTTAPNLTIGHNNGAGTLILDSSTVDATAAYSMLSSNATNGVIVRMKNTSSTHCGGLSDTAGLTCNIPATNVTNTASPAAQTITANTAAIGLCVLPNSASTIPNAPYDNAGTPSGCTNTLTGTSTNAKFGMDDTDTANNYAGGTGTQTVSTYGSPVFHTTGAIHKEYDTYWFAATAADTTPAGIYTATESMIATGTF